MTHDLSQTTETFDVNNDKLRKVNSYPNLKSTVILFFIFILNSLLVGIPAGILGSSGSNSPLLKSLLNLIAYTGTMLVTIMYVIRKSKKHQGYFEKISFVKIQGWLVPVVIIGALALIVPLDRISSMIPMPKSVQKFFEMAFTKDIFSVGVMVVAAPIMEEILCRGIILRGLLKNYPPYKAILISAIFFGAIHLNPWQAIPAFFGGLFMGWVYFKTQSVIPGIIIHATINITITIILFMPHQKQDLLSFLGMPLYISACVFSLVIFIATCFLIQKKVITPEPIN